MPILALLPFLCISKKTLMIKLVYLAILPPVTVYQVIEFTGDTKSEDNLISVMFMCLVKSRRKVRKTRCKEIRAVNTQDGEDNLPQNHLLMTDCYWECSLLIRYFHKYMRLVITGLSVEPKMDMLCT